MLQNCHLGLGFLDELLEILTTTQNIDPQFRLWVTTEVWSYSIQCTSKVFSIVTLRLLQVCN